MALALVRGIIYASVMPPWQAPDEPAQFERVRASLDESEWEGTTEGQPDWYDEISRSLFTFHFWHYAIPDKRPAPGQPLNQYVELYHEIYQGMYSSRIAYLTMGLPLLFAPEQPIIVQLYLTRLNTVLFGVLIVFLGYVITKTIFPTDNFLILGVPILITFSPQHTHMLSTVNNGNLAQPLATIVILLMVRGVMYGFSWPAGIAILTLTVLTIWTKATGYFLIFTIILLCSVYLLRYWRKWPWFLPGAILLIGLTYYFIPTRLMLLIGWAWEDIITGKSGFERQYLVHLFNSFWAMPGWLKMELHPSWYLFMRGLCGVAVLGLIIRLGLLLRRKFSMQKSLYLNPIGETSTIEVPPMKATDARFSEQQIKALGVLATAMMMAMSIQIGWHIVTGLVTYNQGRSLYPVIIPIYIFLLLGWQQFIPVAWQNFGVLVIASFFILFDSLVLFNYIFPFYYAH